MLANAGARGGTIVGGVLGSLVGPEGTLAGAGIGRAIGAISGFAVETVGALWLASKAHEADDAGAKSAEEYDKHIHQKAAAEERRCGLEEKLDRTKGPKTQRPIRDQIERL